MKSVNVMPPLRVQPPGPSTALNVVGSQASITLTNRSDPPATLANAAASPGDAAGAVGRCVSLQAMTASESDTNPTIVLRCSIRVPPSSSDTRATGTLRASFAGKGRAVFHEVAPRTRGSPTRTD